MKDRIGHFDVLRGIAIIGVVAIHASGEGLLSNETNLLFTIIWRNLLNFSVPLFLSISGYFMANKTFTNSEDYYIFLKRSLPRVLLPYLVWSIPYSLLAIKTTNISYETVFKRLLVFQSHPIFYFILLICQIYLLLPVLMKGANKYGLLISSLISIISLAGLYLIELWYKVDIKITSLVWFSPIWLVFYQMGLYFGTQKSIKISRFFLILNWTIFFILSVFESKLLIFLFGSQVIQFSVSAVRFFPFVFSFFSIIYFFSIRIENLSIVENIGKFSFGIYLGHMFIMPFVKIFLKREFTWFGSSLYEQLLVVVVTVGICAMLALTAQTLFGKKFSKDFLGF